jgi:hypothetical protein
MPFGYCALHELKNQEREIEMKTKLQQMSRFAVPAMLVTMMAACASTEEMKKMQQQVEMVRASANSANAAAQEAKAIASEARNTANAASAVAVSAEKASAEAREFASASMKSSEAAVGVSVQAQKSVNDFSITFPWVRLDPATGRFIYQWVVWPSMADYTGAPQVPAAPGK